MNINFSKRKNFLSFQFLRSKKAFSIIALPRSASQFLKNKLCNLTGLKISNLKVDEGFGHFSICIFRVPFGFKPFIWYQHLFPSENNLKLLNKFNVINPIITYREPYSWVLSMSNFLLKNGRTPWGSRLDFVDKEIKKNPNFAIDIVIQYDLPIYIQFLKGWKYFESSNKNFSPLWIPYNNIIDKNFNISEVLLKNDWPINPHYQSSILDKKSTKKFNKNILNEIPKDKKALISAIINSSELDFVYD